MFASPKPSNGESSNSQLYTGVCEMKVVAVNPSQEELKQLGFKAEKAPNYFKQGEYARLAFHLEGTAPTGESIKTQLSFFVKPKLRTELFLDMFGNFKKDRTQLNGNSKNPYEGEIELITFFQSLFNLSKEDHAYFERIDQLVNIGDAAEIQAMVESAKTQNCTVKVLLGVQEEKYQTGYTSKVERSYTKDLSYLHKKLVQDLPYIKDVNYGNINPNMFVPAEFELKPHVANQAAAPQPNSPAPQQAAAANGFGANAPQPAGFGADQASFGGATQTAQAPAATGFVGAAATDDPPF